MSMIRCFLGRTILERSPVQVSTGSVLTVNMVTSMVRIIGWKHMTI